MSTETATPTPAMAEYTTVYVAVELSKKSWLVGVYKPTQDKVSKFTVPGGDGAKLVKELKKVWAREAEAAEKPVRVVSCYEVGCDGFWLHRLLAQHGIENHVVNATELPVSRQAKRAKTDLLDVQTLIRALMARDRGETQACPTVSIPSPEDEDRRRRNRERKELLKERNQLRNRARGLLTTEGIQEFRPEGRNWRDKLESLQTGDGRPLPVRLKEEIKRICERLEQTQEMLQTVTREIKEDNQKAIRKHRTEQSRADFMISNLVQLYGVGDVSATILVDEVFFRDFSNRREVASYVGLAPTPHSSGTMQREQGIDRAGNTLARSTLVELGWLWLRYQPESKLAQWFRERAGKEGSRHKRTLLVALARKLLVALWRYVTVGIVPKGARMKTES